MCKVQEMHSYNLQWHLLEWCIKLNSLFYYQATLSYRGNNTLPLIDQLNTFSWEQDKTRYTITSIFTIQKHCLNTLSPTSIFIIFKLFNFHYIYILVIHLNSSFLCSINFYMPVFQKDRYIRLKLHRQFINTIGVVSHSFKVLMHLPSNQYWWNRIIHLSNFTDCSPRG